ncbi:electron transport complex subunit RsxG [Vibrio maerlii]|uniref:electron transport complex subunit RsxG n=1 Tax=Vibrio maerlii TaxID=2231648 RepID=UPI000E3D6E41|nr:electron transport complex subunit RsxG [Vibrio maerlii]
MIKAIRKNGAVLALFALASTSVVVLTHTLTIDTINEQKEKNLLKQLNQVIPEEMHDNNLFTSCTLLVSPRFLGTDKPMPVYIAKKNNQRTGLAMEAIAPDGYNGNIRILIGFDSWGTVTGVRVLEHNETPGLGDKIDKKVSDWVDSFVGKNLERSREIKGIDGNTGASSRGGMAIPKQSLTLEEWNVRKDGGQFDAFTGATITPRAVVKATKNASIYYHQISESIAHRPQNCGEQR